MTVRSGIVLATLALGGCGQLPFGVSAEESATLACEQRLKAELTSPASYQRVRSSSTPAGPMTEAEEMEALEAERIRSVREGDDAGALSSAIILRCMKNPNSGGCEDISRLQKESPRPDTAFVLLEYQAANRFNVKLPGFFSCRMNVAENGEYSENSIRTSMTVPNGLGRQLKSQAELTQ